ncbi:MAG: aldo/keto reductase, partial [Clostridia bacterium]|nr:aldo/keto reductase [Clostridia bacterium]
LDRWIEEGLTDVLREEHVGCIAFAPLANGMLTGKYLDGIPADSRAARDPRYLKPERITEDKLDTVRKLKAIADQRGQKLHHLALQWVLRDPVVTSALIGASRPEQIVDNAAIVAAPPLSDEELRQIEMALAGA